MGLRKIADFDPINICNHSEHNPPSMIVLEPGIYEYACPACGHITRIVQPQRPTLNPDHRWHQDDDRQVWHYPEPKNLRTFDLTPYVCSPR